MKMYYQTLVSTITLALALAACANFDKTKVPLYEEVFVAPKEPEVDPRRTPPKNPLAMPPGYRKPAFNQQPSEGHTELKDYIEKNIDTSLAPEVEGGEIAYPSLADVPPRPKPLATASQLRKTEAGLTEERDRAQSIKNTIQQEGVVPHDEITRALPPPELPDFGKSSTQGASTQAGLPWQRVENTSSESADSGAQGETLRQAVVPVTLIDPEDEAVRPVEIKDGRPAQQALASPEATHEFGAPREVSGGGHSTATEIHSVGYPSQATSDQDAEQFRLKPFEYKNVPVINKPKIQPPTQVGFNDIQPPPKFLPESRYRPRRVDGPVYHGTYNGYTYFQNQQ